MISTHVLVSLFEFLVTVVMSVMAVYVTFRVFCAVNPDYDSVEELKKGNMAVAILLASIMISASLIILKGVSPVVSLFRLYVTSPGDDSFGVWQLVLYSLAHLLMPFVLAVLTISFSLRMFGRMTKNIQEGKELKKGNAAIGLLLGAVVLIIALFIGEGVASLTKSLVPQPSIGRVRVMR